MTGSLQYLQDMWPVAKVCRDGSWVGLVDINVSVVRCGLLVARMQGCKGWGQVYVNVFVGGVWSVCCKGQFD